MATRTGRPRDPSVAEALERAVVQLVAEHGFDAVSVEQIASAAGVGKPTIYRRWAGKTELFLDAIEHRLRAIPDPPDTGSLRGDLIAMLRAFSSELTANGGLAIGVATTLPGHAELSAAVRVHVSALSRRQAGLVLGRAADRGELPADAVADHFVLDAAAALCLGRAVSGGVDEQFLLRCVDELFLPALHRAAGPSSS